MCVLESNGCRDGRISGTSILGVHFVELVIGRHLHIGGKFCRPRFHVSLVLTSRASLLCAIINSSAFEAVMTKGKIVVDSIMGNMG